MPILPQDMMTGYHVMAKPAGPACNLRCTYCFYLEKYKLYPERKQPIMSEETLEAYIKQYIEGLSHLPEIHFAWQGGEPTLAGLDFFRKAVELQQQYGGGRTIHNALQTNGILIDDEWAQFLAENNFLIGLSLDGPERFHDAFRRNAKDEGTFKQVMNAMETMKRHGVEFNILACVNRQTSEAPEDVYRFLRAHGSGFIQFIPIVERSTGDDSPDKLTLVKPDSDLDATVTPWSVQPLQYGKFLSTVFDLWVRSDVGTVFVQLFDTALEAWMGYDPSLCYFREQCGDAMILESNGDLYSCDHFVYPENLLGNLHEMPLSEMARSTEQLAFGAGKKDKLPAYCRDCTYLFACHGECLKHRFLTTPEGEPGLNYLCEGYRYFFNHVDPYMQFMANELRNRRPPANVMEWVKQQDGKASKSTKPDPNQPCPCGSGKKYKKCCGKNT